MTQTSEPEAGLAQLIKSQATRRAVLGGAGAVGIAAFLAACGTSAGTKTGSAAGTAATDLSDKDKTLNVSNWPLYIDVDGGAFDSSWLARKGE
jgi:spermidine/putrescine transport system substrate-binding protein